MIDWKKMSEEKPTVPDKMYLVQMGNGFVMQVYWSGDAWAEAWGDIFDGGEQPRAWAELNFPRF